MLGYGYAIGRDGTGNLPGSFEVDSLGLSGGTVVGSVLTSVGDGEKVWKDTPGVQTTDEKQGLLDRGQFTGSLDLSHLHLEPQVSRDVHRRVPRVAEVFPVWAVGGVDRHRCPPQFDQFPQVGNGFQKVFPGFDGIMIHVEAEGHSSSKFAGIPKGHSGHVLEGASAVCVLRLGQFQQYESVEFLGGCEDALYRKGVAHVSREDDGVRPSRRGRDVPAADQGHGFAAENGLDVKRPFFEQFAVRPAALIHFKTPPGNVHIHCTMKTVLPSRPWPCSFVVSTTWIFNRP